MFGNTSEAKEVSTAVFTLTPETLVNTGVFGK
jgi:hypothetical protein